MLTREQRQLLHSKRWPLWKRILAWPLAILAVGFLIAMEPVEKFERWCRGIKIEDNDSGR